MLWNGTECGKNRSNENLKATIPSTYAHKSKQLKNVEYFKYLANMFTDVAICTHEINCRISMAKAAFNKMTLFTSKLNLINVR